jgi:hypothetical protein
VLLINDPADDAELAGVMRILLDGPARRQLGEAARSTVLQYSFHRNVDQILEIYREILDRRGGLPHGCQILEARIGREDLRRYAPPGNRWTDIPRMPDWAARQSSSGPSEPGLVEHP